MTTEFENQIKLSNALKGRDLDAVKLLLDAGADPNWYRESVVHETPMNEAAATGFVAGLQALHAAGGNIEGSEAAHLTPLATSARYGHAEAARWLLRHGANIMAISRGPRKEDPLTWALSYGHVDVADVILQERPELHGAVLNAIACDMIAVSRNANVAKWLIDAGISPNTLGPQQDSWLMLVQSSSEMLCAPVSELLIRAGADVNFQDYKGRTALHRTISLKSMPAFMRLLRAGASPDLADNCGDTVRETLSQRADLQHLHEALVAWEASQAAHKIIKASERSDTTDIIPGFSGLKNL